MLTRLALGSRRRRKAFQQAIDPVLRRGALLVDQAAAAARAAAMRMATASVTPGATVSRGCRSACRTSSAVSASNAVGAQRGRDAPARELRPGRRDLAPPRGAPTATARRPPG